LLKAFTASTANVAGEPKATNGGNGNGKPAAKPEPHPFGNGTPQGKATFEEANEDQSQPQEKAARQPVQQDISPADLLGREGFADWREVKIARGKQKGTALGKLTAKSLVWWIAEWLPKPHPKTHKWSDVDLILDAALCLAHAEIVAAERRQNA
jgi:hypothetical protein